MRRVAQWAVWLATDWRGEYPLQLHTKALAHDGSHEWHPDFAHWLVTGRRARKGDSKRTTRVMRQLRKHAVREYEVLYRILVLGEKVADTAKWLNERAAKNDIPFPDHRPDGPHYTEKDAYALFIAGIDYAKEHW